MNRLILSAGAHLTEWQNSADELVNAATIVVSLEREDGTPVRFIGKEAFNISLLTVDSPLANPPILRPLSIVYFATSPIGDGHFFVLVVVDDGPESFLLLGALPVILTVTVDDYIFIPTTPPPFI